VQGETSEALPVADEASLFRGSGTIFVFRQKTEIVLPQRWARVARRSRDGGVDGAKRFAFASVFLMLQPLLHNPSVASRQLPLHKGASLLPPLVRGGVGFIRSAEARKTPLPKRLRREVGCGRTFALRHI